MTPEQIIGTIVAVLVSSGLQAVLTVQAVKVHIQYLKESADRAHARIDKLQSERARARVDELQDLRCGN